MSIPNFTMRQLVEVGAHFGHTTKRWNTGMKPYLFGVRNGVHIIDLDQTRPLLRSALMQIHEVAARGGRVLFVGTKTQGRKSIREAAERSGQYFVNHRWLGGTLTNWKTIANSIKRMKDLEETLAEDNSWRTKREVMVIRREHQKLERSLGGIRNMSGVPDMLFVLDTNQERIAVNEAKRCGIPVIAILDSNSDPSNVTYPIPGNDDALKAITFYLDLMVGAILSGLRTMSSLETAPGGSETAKEPPPPEPDAATLTEKPS